MSIPAQPRQRVTSLSIDHPEIPTLSVGGYEKKRVEDVSILCSDDDVDMEDGSSGDESDESTRKILRDLSTDASFGIPSATAAGNGLGDEFDPTRHLSL